MANRTRLTLVIEGLESDDKDVDFRVFTAKLEAVRAALRHAEGEARDIRYKVVDLKHTSATLVLEPDDDTATNTLLDAISGIRQRRSISTPETDKLFDDVKELVKGVGQKFSRIKLTAGGRSTVVDAELSEAVHAVERTDTTGFGSIKGAIQRFNSHDDANYFYLYPRIGSGVKCVFPKTLLSDAAAAVEHNVTVTGLLKYRKGKYRPYECTVRSIDVHQTDSELPKLSDIAGTIPGLTGDHGTLDFIRRSRSAWED